MLRPIPDVPPTNMATGVLGKACPALEERIAENMVAVYRMRRAALRATACKMIIKRRILARYYIDLGFRIGRERVWPVA